MSSRFTLLRAYLLPFKRQWHHIISDELLCVCVFGNKHFDTCYGFNIIDIVRLFVNHSFLLVVILRHIRMFILVEQFLNDVFRAHLML